jgi:hypothetical protein
MRLISRGAGSEDVDSPRRSILVVAPVCTPLISVAVAVLILPRADMALLLAVFLWCYALIAVWETPWFRLRRSRWALAWPVLLALAVTAVVVAAGRI